MATQWDRAKEGFERARDFVTRDVWHLGRPGEEVPHGFIVKQVRVGIVLVQNLIEDKLLLRASALTFATILAIVPFLAIIFMIIQAFSIDEHIFQYTAVELEELLGSSAVAQESGGDGEPVLDQLKEALRNTVFQGVGKTDTEDIEDPLRIIFDYAFGAANYESIGLMGLLFLIVSVFGFMLNIESSFNTIWGLKRSRSWFRIFSDYVVVILLLPFIVTAVLGVMVALQSNEVARQLGALRFLVLIIQYAFVWLIFATMYTVIPNTRVRFRYALLGGIVAGTAWLFASLLYVTQFRFAQYSMLYSTLAQVPVLLMWIFASWAILLFGAELVFAYQNEKTFVMERLAEGASYAYREALALRTMVEVGRRFENGESGLVVVDAAEEWNVPVRLLNDTLTTLEDAGLVTPVRTEPVTFQPARPPRNVFVRDVVRATRDKGREPSQLRGDDSYGGCLQKLDALGSPFEQRTVLDIIEEEAREAPGGTKGPGPDQPETTA